MASGIIFKSNILFTVPRFLWLQKFTRPQGQDVTGTVWNVEHLVRLWTDSDASFYAFPLQLKDDVFLVKLNLKQNMKGALYKPYSVECMLNNP